MTRQNSELTHVRSHPNRFARDGFRSLKEFYTAGEITARFRLLGSDDVEHLSNGVEVQMTSLDELRRFAQAGYLYAVLDACDAQAVPEKARELGDAVAVSLFKGSAQENYWAVSPYLFNVRADTLEWIVATLWKDPWGIFVISKADLETLHRHLRRFLLVRMESGEHQYFRYYDPRVLSLYLELSEARDLPAFYGPVRAFAVSDAERGQISLLKGAAASTSPQPERPPALLWEITPKQRAAFEARAEQDFHLRVERFLRQHLPQQTLGVSPDTLTRGTQMGIERARSHGIRGESAITAFVAMLLEVGPRFDQCTLFRRLLSDASISRDSLMRVLVDTATEQDWNEMRTGSTKQVTRGGVGG